MNYYQDITLIPDGEVSLSFLWTKVFTQLHLALAEEKRREGMVKTALAFPAYQDKGWEIRSVSSLPRQNNWKDFTSNRGWNDFLTMYT